MSEASVAVVVLNYNGRSFLEKFLPGILQHSAPHQVVVADNGSSDGSLEFLAQNFPTVQRVDNQGNFGYAKGYNLALKSVQADYYVLLNSDVEVTENWIHPILQLMEKNRQIAACQPKILDFNQRHLFEYAGASGGFIDAYGYPFCRGRVFNTLEQDQGQYNDAREVFWATGACLFIRSTAFWQAGGLDDDYFAHMEEIDLCWRLKNLGYSIYTEPASVIYHIGGGTLNKLSSQKTFLNFRNNLSTLTKNHPPGFLFFKVLYRLVLDGVAAFKFLSDGQPKHLWAVLRAHFAYYAWLPSILQKRKVMKNKPGFRFSTSHMYHGNIVMEYFLKGKKAFSELSSGFLTK
jgi:GT2 family glycosyltransferase